MKIMNKIFLKIITELGLSLFNRAGFAMVPVKTGIHTALMAAGTSYENLENP